MNRGRPKHHVKVSVIRYVDKHGISHTYHMDELKSNKPKENDIKIKIKIPNFQNKKQQNKEHFNDQVETDKSISTKLRNALSFYNGDIKELYFEAHKHMQEKYPQLLNDPHHQNCIKENEGKSEENNFFTQTRQLNFPANEIFNEDSFQEKHDEEDQIPKPIFQTLNDFEEITDRNKELNLLKLELNSSPPEYQEIDNSNTSFDFQSLYL